MFKFYNTLYHDIISSNIDNTLTGDNKKTCKALFSLFISIKNKKITYFFNNIYGNIFTSQINKNICLDIFCITQKYYHALNKFIRIYKIKKLPVNNEQDLGLQCIHSIKNLIKTDIIENNVRYCFKIADLICLINNSLLSSIEYLYPCPVEIKNPYTNIPFLKSTLYNIYFIIKNSTFNMPVLYNIYYACNFDLKIFYYDSESLLKDILIKNYTNCISSVRIFREIKRMFRDNVIIGNDNKIKLKQIHQNFPSNTLIDVFTPFLNIYLQAIYSLNISKKYNCKTIIRKKFKAFFIENPIFGRKCIKKKNVNNDIFVFGCQNTEIICYETTVKNKFNNINIDNTNIDSVFIDNSLGHNNNNIQNILDINIDINNHSSDDDTDYNTD